MSESPAPPLRAVPRNDDAGAPSDVQLLERLSDDPDALGTLYDRHANLVYGLAMSVLRDPNDAEDLVSEVFVGLSTHHTYDPTRGTLPAYLISLTRSRAIDRLRSGGRRLRLLKEHHESSPETDAPSTPQQLVADAELGGRVRSALAELSDREREVIELSYYRGMTQAEIAEHLDAPLGSVKSWARRGLRRMQEGLRDLVS